VAVVLTLAQKKQIRINIHKRNNTKNIVRTIQNTENTSIRAYYKTLTLTKPTHYKQIKITTVQVKTNTIQDIHK